MEIIQLQNNQASLKLKYKKNQKLNQIEPSVDTIIQIP